MLISSKLHYQHGRSGDTELSSQTARADDPKLACELALWKMSPVGAADHVGVGCDGRRDQVDVVGVKLARDNPQLLRQVGEEILPGAPGQVVHHLADRPVVQPGLTGQRAPDGGRSDVVWMEQRIESIEELLDDLDVVPDTAEPGERVAHELHSGNLGCEAIDQYGVSGKLEQPEVVAGRFPERAAQDRCIEADAHSGLPAVDDLLREILVGYGRIAAD
jgi:hypothetical protein